jgi:hypothetical protein
MGGYPVKEGTMERHRPSCWMPPRPAPHGRSHAWLTIIGPVITGLAAGALVAALPSDTQPASGTPATTLTVKILADRAAAAALTAPPVKPGQWVYRKTVTAPINPAGARSVTLETWATADGNKAFISNSAFIIGRPVSYAMPPWKPQIPNYPMQNRISYSSLGSMPANPHALVTRLGNTYSGGPAAYRDGRAFQIIGNMLRSYVMSPAMTAELYKALGDIPGVMVARNVADLAGRRGVAFRIPMAPGMPGYREIIVNPHSYQYMAWQSPQGRGIGGEAILREALVPGPGVRPGLAAPSSAVHHPLTDDRAR